MNRILSRISGPLLIGSILALGAMAWPGHASAEARFFFRGSGGLLPMQVAAVPEEDGTAGEDEEPRGEAFMRFAYSHGWTLECKTDWSAAKLAQYRDLLETRPEVTWNMGSQVFTGVIPATAAAWFYGSATFPQWLAFEAYHSTFAYEYYEDDGRVELRAVTPPEGDPRDYPADAASGPSPCSNGTAEMVEVGPSPNESGNMFYPVTLESVELVYR